MKLDLGKGRLGHHIDSCPDDLIRGQGSAESTSEQKGLSQTRRMTQSSRPDQSVSVNLPGLPPGAADPCVHCGFCLPTCASYRVLASEMDSPRGRIHALRAIEAGELELDASVASHFDTCLGCFACVSACPSGVRYDQLIEHTRPKLIDAGQRSPWDVAFRRLLLQVLPYPSRLRALLQPLRIYAGTPLQALARRAGLTRLFGPQIEAMERLLPPLAADSYRDHLPQLNPEPATGERRGRVALLLGCVQRCFDPAVSKATVAVLQANGFEVVLPPDQGCCGASESSPGRTGADPPAGLGSGAQLQRHRGGSRCGAGGSLRLRPHR